MQMGQTRIDARQTAVIAEVSIAAHGANTPLCGPIHEDQGSEFVAVADGAWRGFETVAIKVGIWQTSNTASLTQIKSVAALRALACV